MSTTYSTSSIEIDDNLSQTCSQDSSPTENSSFSPSTCASSAKKQKQLGRKNNPEADILSQFYTLRGSTTGQPKKEYLRCKLIRGHKRANRQIEKKMLPAKSFNFYNKENQDSIANWNKLIEIHNKHKTILNKISKSKYGNKSFNSSFCTEYFTPVEARESLYYYIEYLFSDFEPEILCKKFNFYCCNSKKHWDCCYENWGKLKEYMRDQMISDLNLEAWKPQSVFLEETAERNPQEYLDFWQPTWIRKIYVQKLNFGDA